MHILRRRSLIAASAAVLLPGAAWAQQQAATSLPSVSPLPPELAPNPVEFQRLMTAFTQGRTPEHEGLELDMSVLADNPSAVPVRVKLALSVSGQEWCEEIIILAALNPSPLVCRLRFTQAAGAAETAVRVRLSQSQTVHALALMKGGRLLAAQQAVMVATSGCGM